MRWSRAFLAAGMTFSCTLLLCISGPERQLAVYTPQKSYSVEAQDRDGETYIGLMDLVEPLGTIGMRQDGKEWKLRFNGAEARFTQGQSTVKIGGKSVDLGSKVLVYSKRVLVPLRGSFALLNALLKVPVEVHPGGRRIFIDNAATRFMAELKKGDRSSLLLNFDRPVNPTVTREDNKIQLTFRREPLISDLTSQPWDDKTIHSLNFSEDNGTAFLTIAGAGLTATVSNDGRTITVQAPPATIATASPPQISSPEGSLPMILPAPQQLEPPPVNPAHGPPAFWVMIDPGHGGDDPGAVLGDKLIEKEITLALARRLKSELQERGIPAHLLRDGDVTLSLEQRAQTANEQHASVYVALHAGLPGSGVRVYAPALASSPPLSSGRFLPWGDAQANSLARSQELAQTIVGELDKKSITALKLATPIRPLNNVTAPAVAVELAPDPDNMQDIMAQKFQSTVAAGIAAGIAQLRPRLEGQP